MSDLAPELDDVDVEPQVFLCRTDDDVDTEELVDEHIGWPKTYAEARERIAAMSDFLEEWEGIPMPLDDQDLRLVVRPNHPLHGFFVPSNRSCSVEDVSDDERVVNHWYDGRRNREVYIVDRGGRRSAVCSPCAPDRSMDRFDLWARTTGAIEAWDLDAEYRARDLLHGMLTEHQWRQYELTGAFFETSPRSQVVYFFRRLRPTVALTMRSRSGEPMVRVLAVLCLHPIGYYGRSWAGCMVPTDDVIAHLTLVRADEARFWGKAHHHAPHEPEAGL